MQGRQNERNSSYVKLAHTSIFGLCFMSVCLMKSNCYSFIYSSLGTLLPVSSSSNIKTRMRWHLWCHWNFGYIIKFFCSKCDLHLNRYQCKRGFMQGHWQTSSKEGPKKLHVVYMECIKSFFCNMILPEKWKFFNYSISFLHKFHSIM